MWHRCSRFAVALMVLLAGVLIASVEPSHAQYTQTVRKSITAFSPAELMSLRKGVAVMKSRDTAPRDSETFRGSWVYWANIHGHFGDDCRGPIVGKGMTGLKLWIATYPARPRPGALVSMARRSF